MNNSFVKKLFFVSGYFLITSAESNANDKILVDFLRFRPHGKSLLVRVINPYNDQKGNFVDIWSTSTMKRLRTLPSSRVVFSPDNTSYVAPGHPMQLWSLKGAVLRSFPSDKGTFPLAISADRTLIVGAGGPGWLVLWNFQNGGLLAKTTYPNTIGAPVFFAPDAKSFYALSDAGIAQINASDAQRKVYLQQIRLLPVENIGYSFDINFQRGYISFLTGNPSQEIQKTAAQLVILNLKGALIRKITLSVNVYGDNSIARSDVQFSSGGHYLAVRHRKEILIYSVPSLRLLRRYQPKRFNLYAFTAIDFSPNDNRLAIGGWGKSVPIIIRLP